MPFNSSCKLKNKKSTTILYCGACLDGDTLNGTSFVPLVCIFFLWKSELLYLRLHRLHSLFEVKMI